MAVSTLTGLVDDNVILADERIVDMDNVIAMLDPDVSQFTTMLMKIASSPAYNSKIEWLEDQLFPRLSALIASAASSDTTLAVTVGTGAYFRAGDVVRMGRTGEVVRVTAISTDTIGVTRAIATVTAASMDSTYGVVIVGNASLQGATLGTRKVTKRVLNYNYEQIQRNPYGFTETLIASRLYGGGAMDKERKKKAIEHKRAIENTLFFGGRALVTSGANPVGYSGGVDEFIVTNNKNPGGVITKANLDDYFRAFLQHGSTNKVLFAAPLVAQAISGFLRDNWVRSQPGDQVWGVAVDAFISGAYGYQIPVVVKRDWNDFQTTVNQYGGRAYLVDLDYVKFRPLRETRHLTGRQGNDADEQDEEYLTEFSLEFAQEAVHGVIQGVTG
jgi:hypothetical protein